MYIDEDGEIAWFIPVIVGVVGGIVNLVANIANGNLNGYGFWETVGRGAAAFGAGAVQGVSACFGPGWASVGGTVAGGVNAWLSGKRCSKPKCS